MQTYMSGPKTLQVFKNHPSSQQVDDVIRKYVTSKKIDPVPFLYTEKPQIHVVPIPISYDILLK